MESRNKLKEADLHLSEALEILADEADRLAEDLVNKETIAWDEHDHGKSYPSKTTHRMRLILQLHMIDIMLEYRNPFWKLQ